MIPEFLDNYKGQLEEFKLPSVSIKAIPVENEEILNFRQSKFLGKPYLPLNFEYPKDGDGKPLILLAQINFDELPRLEGYPTSGILQFYIPSSNWYDMSDY